MTIQLAYDFDHYPGIYLAEDADLTVDPDHPGFYLVDDADLIVDPDHVGIYLAGSVIDPTVPDPVVGSTVVSIDGGAVMRLDPIVGSTTVTVDLVAGQTLVMDRVQGRTDVEIAILVPGVRYLQPDVVTGRTDVRILFTPHLSDNVPILLAFTARMRLEALELVVSE